MDETILRYLTGNASPAELSELDRWRRASPENERQFQLTVRVWSHSAGSIPESVVAPPNVSDVIARAAELPGESGDADPGTGSVGFPAGTTWSRRHRRVLALAATVAAVAITATLVRNAADGRRTSAPPIATTADTPRNVRLPDGSWVRLAPGARLADVSMGDTRAVRLEGRAYFAIAPDSMRPFTVATGAVTARVLGTRFEVREFRDSVRVAVVEGLVEVRTDTAVARIPAGSIATASAAGTLVVSTPADTRDLLDWSGLLPFHGTALADAAAEIERWSGYRVIITDSLLARRRVTVAFEDESVADVIAVLCEIAGATCSTDVNALTVTVRAR